MPEQRSTIERSASRPVPRERTFAELFPWRNMRRVVMLVLLIVAIVVLKRSTGGFLARVGDMWGGPAPAPAPMRMTQPTEPATAGRTIRLGPGLAPSSATDPR